MIYRFKDEYEAEIFAWYFTAFGAHTVRFVCANGYMNGLEVS